jgi:hypothetical protein
MNTRTMSFVIAASLSFLSAAAAAAAPPSPDLVQWAAGYGYHVKTDVNGADVFCATIGREPFTKVVCAPKALMAICFQNKKKPIFGQGGYVSYEAWVESCHA